MDTRMTAVNIKDYMYDLPPERIALFPLAQRDSSRLLVYNAGTLYHEIFSHLDDHLPSNSFLFFNDTKVIPARMVFEKDTGAQIEIFLLNPVAPSTLLVEVMEARTFSSWKCTVGNLKRWTSGTALIKNAGGTELKAELLDRAEGIVRFSWSNNLSFAEIIASLGETPLPPYLKRKPEEQDKERYQTIYSHYAGAVAAPTAGLHFTAAVFDSLKKKNIQTDFLTLHVSAGTFQPVKTENAAEHQMHKEQIIVNRDNVLNLLQRNKFIVPVGTTSMRTLESLYWFGVKLLENPDAVFNIRQHDPYTKQGDAPEKERALEAVLEYMNRHAAEIIIGETSIYIMPGYRFRVADALITNFHQPGSTLILLVAAFIGEDWRKLYEEALDNNYRFLSYGDSSLLIPAQKKPAQASLFE